MTIPHRSRYVTLAGVGLLAGAGVLAAGALSMGRDAPAGQSVAVTPLTAASIPPTVAPIVVETTPVTTVAEPSPPPTTASASTIASSTTSTTAAPTTSTTLPLSALNDELGDPISVRPRRVRTLAVVPVRMTIESLGVTVPVRPVGVEPSGELEIPDETEAGWYHLGAAPGEPGATVLAAHVSWNRTAGPFARLAELEPGATVSVDRGDGTTRVYEVIERAQYPKTALPTDRIWTRAGRERLVLITCGGAFNPDIRRYADNIVVYAVPIA